MNKNYSKHFMCIQILTSEKNTFSIQIKLLWEAAGAWTHLHLSDYFKNLWYYTFPTLHICLQGTHMENLMLLYFNWMLHWMYVSRTYETNKKNLFSSFRGNRLLILLLLPVMYTNLCNSVTFHSLRKSQNIITKVFKTWWWHDTFVSMHDNVP